MALAETLRTGDHLHDHIALHSMIGGSLSTDIEVGDIGHPDAHELIHAATGLALPTDITPGSPGHDQAHRLIHEWWNDEFPTHVGPRGIVGPTDPANIADFPQSGLTTVSPGATTVQTAVANGSDDEQFLLEAGTYTLTSRIEPKAGQGFWCEQGVIFAKGTGSHNEAFFGLTNRNGVKIVNAFFGAFHTGSGSRAIHAGQTGQTTGWEVAHCEVDGEDTMHNGVTAHWIHHNRIYGVLIGAHGAFAFDDVLIEDNDVGPVCSVVLASQGNKLVGTLRAVVRHNYYHGNGTGNNLTGTGLWLDYMNFDALLEWNRFEDNLGPGVFFEGNYWNDDTAAPGVFTNTTRYNLFRNNGGAGFMSIGSSFNEVHDNALETNRAVVDEGEFHVTITLNKQNAQNAESYQNHFHHNVVTPRANRRGAFFNAPADVIGVADYESNANDNTWDHNTYHLSDVAAGNHFFWASSGNRTWAQWQAVPAPNLPGQDANGSAEQV